MTQQDIAKALRLSRNTISKSLSGHPAISDKTRRLVLKKAHEMGYLQPGDALQASLLPEQPGSIGLFCRNDLRDHAFWSLFLPGLVDYVSKAGYQLNIFIISDDEEESCRLPGNWRTESISGIVFAGVFSPNYIRMVLTLDIPLVMYDTTSDFMPPEMVADVIMMDNTSGIQQITQDLINKGHRKIGFIGDRSAAMTIQERWLGYCLACLNAGFVPDPKFSLTSPTANHYYKYEEILKPVSLMSELPTAFVCAADDIALNLVRYLSSQGLQIPEDIAVSGFDNFEESYDFDPELTTVKCFPDMLGARAGESLLRRINDRNLPFEIIRMNIEVCIRRSTNRFI